MLTSCSWLNAVEGFFAMLSKRLLKPAGLRSVVDLQAAINRFITESNRDPRPFAWTATSEAILEKIAKLCKAIYGYRR